MCRREWCYVGLVLFLLERQRCREGRGEVPSPGVNVL